MINGILKKNKKQNKKANWIILSLMCLAVFWPFSTKALNSQKIDIKLYSPDSFKVGEMVYFKYTFYSSQRIETKFYESITCNEGIRTVPALKSIVIKPKIFYTRQYDGFKVSQKLKAQKCIAKIETISPIKKTVVKNFKIIASPKNIIDRPTIDEGQPTQNKNEKQKNNQSNKLQTCNNNNLCEVGIGENEENCVSDCVEKKNNNIGTVIGLLSLGILFLLLGGYLLWRFLKNRI